MNAEQLKRWQERDPRTLTVTRLADGHSILRHPNIAESLTVPRAWCDAIMLDAAATGRPVMVIEREPATEGTVR